MFGAEYQFTWNTVTKKLLIHRKIKADDTVFVHVYKNRSDEELLTDPYSSPWLKEYALAHAKLMLAEARGKFNTIAGPQGGTSLNADVLRQDAQASMEKDPAKRAKLYTQLEEIIIEEAPVAPIYQYASSRLVKPYLRGVDSKNNQDIQYVRNMYIVAH